MGGLDFPVHISSGAAALAYSFIIGRRCDRTGQISRKVSMYHPHDVTMVVLGIVMLWFGWFGFNGGSSLNSSLRSTYAATNDESTSKEFDIERDLRRLYIPDKLQIQSITNSHF